MLYCNEHYFITSLDGGSLCEIESLCIVNVMTRRLLIYLQGKTKFRVHCKSRCRMNTEYTPRAFTKDGTMTSSLLKEATDRAVWACGLLGKLGLADRS